MACLNQKPHTPPISWVHDYGRKEGRKEGQVLECDSLRERITGGWGAWCADGAWASILKGVPGSWWASAPLSTPSQGTANDVHSFIQPTFTEHLLCPRREPGSHNPETMRLRPRLHRAHSPVEESNTQGSNCDQAPFMTFWDRSLSLR